VASSNAVFPPTTNLSTENQEAATAAMLKLRRRASAFVQ
jgi:hypothetical protein